MTTDTKQIQDDAVHRQEPLRVRSGGKPPHLSFALPGRLVRRLGSIVLVLPRAVLRFDERSGSEVRRHALTDVKGTSSVGLLAGAN